MCTPIVVHVVVDIPSVLELIIIPRQVIIYMNFFQCFGDVVFLQSYHKLSYLVFWNV